MLKLDKHTKIVKGVAVGGDILTLSNNARYVVVTTTLYEDKNYIYLVNEDDQTDIMFCEYQGEDFEKVVDQRLIEQLLNLIKPEMQEILGQSE